MTIATCLIYSLFPDEESARTAARAVVRERLAACCNLLPGLGSIYEWEGKEYEENEIVLICKTTSALSTALIAALRAHHSYTCPAIVQLPIEGGYPPFLEWVAAQCKPLQP